MVQYSYFNRVIESIDHSKNGMNSKKTIKRKSFVRGVCLAIILIMVTTCKKEDEMDKFFREPFFINTVSRLENGIEISWNEVRGADYYQVEWSEQNFSVPQFGMISPRIFVKTNYIIENPIDGDGYYRVIAYKCKKLRDCYCKYSDVAFFNYTDSQEITVPHARYR